MVQVTVYHAGPVLGTLQTLFFTLTCQGTEPHGGHVLAPSRTQFSSFKSLPSAAKQGQVRMSAELMVREGQAVQQWECSTGLEDLPVPLLLVLRLSVRQ